MKNKYFLLISFLFIQSNVFGQSLDFQWIVWDGKGKDGINNFTTNNFINPPITAGKVKLEGVADPMPATTNSNEYDNDFFAIFDDGSYFLDRSTAFGSLSSSNYTLETTKAIAYMYLSNIYEEDDPPRDLKVVNPVPPVGPAIDFEGNNQVSINYISNHDVLNRRDITFIIDGGDTRLTSGQFNKICYDSNIDVEFIPVPFEGANNVLRQVISTSTMESEYAEFMFDSGSERNCLRFQYIDSNIFFNFRTNFPNGIPLQRTVKFNLYSADNSEIEVASFPENISDKYHDPNGITLKCLWEESGAQHAKYKVECFNESDGQGVNHVKMELILPDFMNIESIKLNNWKIGTASGCGESGVTLTQSAVNSHLIIMDYHQADTLSIQSNGNNIAWFEFTVEFSLSGTNPNLYTLDFQPSLPRTYFVNTPYPIVSYSQDTICQIEEQTRVTCRIKRKRCCKQCNSWSFVCLRERIPISLPVGGAGLAALLAGGALRRREKKRNKKTDF